MASTRRQHEQGGDAQRTGRPETDARRECYQTLTVSDGDLRGKDRYKSDVCTNHAGSSGGVDTPSLHRVVVRVAGRHWSGFGAATTTSTTPAGCVAKALCERSGATSCDGLGALENAYQVCPPRYLRPSGRASTGCVRSTGRRSCATTFTPCNSPSGPKCGQVLRDCSSHPRLYGGAAQYSRW